MNNLARTGRTLFAVAIIGLGTEQFIFGEFVTGRVPAWSESVPGELIWIYLSGVVFVAIGAVILYGKNARSAAILAGGLIFA